MAGIPDVPIDYTVGPVQGALFIATGVLLDAFDLAIGITGVGEVADEAVDMVADVAIPMHAWLIGIPLGGNNAGKKMGMLIACETAKIVPVLNLAPTYTYETWRLLKYSREEDREKAAERAAAQENELARQQAQQRAVLEQRRRIEAVNEDLREAA